MPNAASTVAVYHRRMGLGVGSSPRPTAAHHRRLMPLPPWTSDHAPARAIAAPSTVERGAHDGQPPVRPLVPLPTRASAFRRGTARGPAGRNAPAPPTATSDPRPPERPSTRPRAQPQTTASACRAVRDQRPQAATHQHHPQRRQARAHVSERPSERTAGRRPHALHRGAVPNERRARGPHRPRREPRHARCRTRHEPSERGTDSRPNPGHAGAVVRKHPTESRPTVRPTRVAPRPMTPRTTRFGTGGTVSTHLSKSNTTSTNNVRRRHREREEQRRLTGTETRNAVVGEKTSEHSGRDDDRARREFDDQLCSAFHAASRPITIRVAARAA